MKLSSSEQVKWREIQSKGFPWLHTKKFGGEEFLSVFEYYGKKDFDKSIKELKRYHLRYRNLRYRTEKDFTGGIIYAAPSNNPKHTRVSLKWLERHVEKISQGE